MTQSSIATTLAAVACIASLIGARVAAAQTAASPSAAQSPDYEVEIAKFRPLVGNPATHDEAMEQLGALAVRAANDLDVALALGDSEKVEKLDRIIRERLGDTRLRVERRAEENDPDALAALGMFYARNLLAARNVERACRAFVRAAELEHVGGAYQAALCLLKSDSKSAASWMQRAADAGHPAAQEAVGRACLERKPNPQLDCAVRYVRAAAQTGRPSALSLLGWMHANGVGVAQDMQRASELYLEAARKRDAAAQNNLGEMYEKGVWVRKNERLAASWYRQAAQDGFAPAQFNLGRMYALGAGVEHDEMRARIWLEKAKVQGITQADDLLRWLNERSDRRPER